MNNPSDKKKSILIAGGTGLVGSHLIKKLKAKNYNVSILSQSANTDIENVFAWNIEENTIQEQAIQDVDYIINLSGENIGAKRWSKKQKNKIITSRVNSTNLIHDVLKKSNVKIKAYISASAIGYYGQETTDVIYTEKNNAGSDFLGKTCELWEKSADSFENLKIRVVKIRTAVVLTKKGGALEKMIAPINIGIGSALGNGKQYIPWIHIDDLCEIYIKAIEDVNMKGAYNAVSPEHYTNSQFTRLLSNTLKKPFWFPNVPAFMLKIIFGEMSVLLLKGSRISSEKIINSDFKFRYSSLKTAIQDLYLND